MSVGNFRGTTIDTNGSTSADNISSHELGIDAYPTSKDLNPIIPTHPKVVPVSGNKAALGIVSVPFCPQNSNRSGTIATSTSISFNDHIVKAHGMHDSTLSPSLFVDHVDMSSTVMGQFCEVSKHAGSISRDDVALNSTKTTRDWDSDPILPLFVDLDPISATHSPDPSFTFENHTVERESCSSFPTLVEDLNTTFVPHSKQPITPSNKHLSVVEGTNTHGSLQCQTNTFDEYQFLIDDSNSTTQTCNINDVPCVGLNECHPAIINIDDLTCKALLYKENFCLSKYVLSRKQRRIISSNANDDMWRHRDIKLKSDMIQAAIDKVQASLDKQLKKELSQISICDPLLMEDEAVKLIAIFQATREAKISHIKIAYDNFGT